MFSVIKEAVSQVVVRLAFGEKGCKLLADLDRDKAEQQRAAASTPPAGSNAVAALASVSSISVKPAAPIAPPVPVVVAVSPAALAPREEVDPWATRAMPFPVPDDEPSQSIPVIHKSEHRSRPAEGGAYQRQRRYFDGELIRKTVFKDEQDRCNDGDESQSHVRVRCLAPWV